jgi:hypothetical protein
MNAYNVEALRTSIQVLQIAAFSASYDAGWWTQPDGTDVRDNPYCFGLHCGLIHTEISEAMEGDRTDAMDKHLPHRPSREVELADAFSRILLLAGAYNLDLAGAFIEKAEYNLRRADHKREARAGANGKKY